MLTHSIQPPRDPSRVVVLGATGFIGGRLVSRLQAKGIPVLPISSRDIDLALDGAGAALATRLDRNDAIVFLSIVTPDKGRGIPTFLRNLHMARSVCDAVAQTMPAHVICVSSDAVYPMSDVPTSESSPCEPTDLYAAAHISREIMLTSTVTSSLAILRPTLVYGAGDPHNSYGPNRLRRQAAREHKLSLFGAGEERRDHIYVEDVVSLIVLTLRHRSAGTLNLATGQSISYADVAAQIAALFSGPIPIVGLPRKNAITHRSFDIAHLRAAFPGFKFTPLADGLAAAHHAEILNSGDAPMPLVASKA